MSSKCESGAYMYISLLFIITLSTTALTDADNSWNSRCLTLVTKIDKIIFVIPRLNSKLVIILVVQITLSFHWLASIGLKWHHRFFSRKDWGSREYLKFIYVERLPVYSKMISKKKKKTDQLDKMVLLFTPWKRIQKWRSLIRWGPLISLC